MNLFLLFFISFLFLGLSAFFSSMETALFSLSITEKYNLKKRNPNINWLFKNQNNTLITILFLNTFVNIGFSLCIDKISFRFLGENGIGMIASIISATTAVLIFGEIFPKNYAIYYRSYFSEKGSKILTAIVKSLSVFTTYITKFIKLIQNKLKTKYPQTPSIMKDELFALAGLQRKKSFLSPEEKTIIQNIPRLSNLKAYEIMTPRVKTKMIDITEKEEKIIEKIKEFKHKYIPVYKNNIDNIVGILDAKTFLLTNAPLRIHIKKPYFIPETKKVLPLLVEMKEKKEPMCFVIDEYGGFQGIITMEDIIEEIIGDIFDEFDPYNEVIYKQKENIYLISGDAKLKDIEETTKIKLDGDPLETINAYILKKTEDIPKKGYEYKVNEKLSIIIKKTTKRKISQLEFRIKNE